MIVPYASGLDRLYAEIERLGACAGVLEFCPRPENRLKEDRCWIEENSQDYFVEYYMERGQKSVVVDGAYDQVVFEVMRLAAQSLATRLELQKRIAGQDTRRQWYALQRNIMAKMKPEWASRVAQHQALTLAYHPYRDDLDLA